MRRWVTLLSEYNINAGRCRRMHEVGKQCLTKPGAARRAPARAARVFATCELLAIARMSCQAGFQALHRLFPVQAAATNSLSWAPLAARGVAQHRR